MKWLALADLIIFLPKQSSDVYWKLHQSELGIDKLLNERMPKRVTEKEKKQTNDKNIEHEINRRESIESMHKIQVLDSCHPEASIRSITLVLCVCVWVCCCCYRTAVRVFIVLRWNRMFFKPIYIGLSMSMSICKLLIIEMVLNGIRDSGWKSQSGWVVQWHLHELQTSNNDNRWSYAILQTYRTNFLNTTKQRIESKSTTIAQSTCKLTTLEYFSPVSTICKMAISTRNPFWYHCAIVWFQLLVDA